MDEIFISRGTSGPLTPFTHSPPPLSLEWRTRRKERWTRMRKWRRRRRDEKSREERAARSAQDQGHELHHLHHLMFSSRALSSYFLELNPQTLTQVSLHAWMDHELWKLLYHPKSKIKSCYNSILSCFLQSLSHEFMEFLQELSNPSLWLGSKVTQGFIFILVAWEPPKIRAKFSCPISRI
jgi:hypothetical protein